MSLTLTAQVDKYIKVCNFEEKNELAAYFNATGNNLTAYNEEPTAVRLKDWELSKKALAQYLEKLSLIYPDIKTETADGGLSLLEKNIIFPTRKAVFDWLKTQSRWQISQRTLYNHARSGLLRADKKGNYSIKAVLSYARKHLVEISSGLKADDNIEALQEAKLRKEIEHRDQQIKKLKRQEAIDKGKWFPTADLEMEVASRAAILTTGLSYEVTTR
ncbi:hypothetical protein KAI46_02885, partial [bacterium]|nr:hypothetical protein [bacterium]